MITIAARPLPLRPLAPEGLESTPPACFVWWERVADAARDAVEAVERGGLEPLAAGEGF